MKSSTPANVSIDWLPVDTSQPVIHEESGDGLLTHISHRAMATNFVVILPREDAEQVEVAVNALDQLDAIESKLTVYQPDSEISLLNRLGYQRPVPVSWSTFRLLERAMLWSRRTKGAFDITAGPLVEAWGFTHRQGRKPSKEEIESSKLRVGYQKIVLDPASLTVGFTEPNMSINLGAIGKGFALDRLGGQLREAGVCDFLIHGGHSSVIAAGDQKPGSDQGWPVGIAHPTKSGYRLAGIWLKNQALGTSGSGKQFFHHRGRRYGHVIDPRSGYPAGDLQSITTLAETATDADACATGLFVAGSTQIQNWADQPWLASTLLVRETRRQDTSEITWIGEIPWVVPPERK